LAVTKAKYSFSGTRGGPLSVTLPSKEEILSDNRRARAEWRTKTEISGYFGKKICFICGPKRFIQNFEQKSASKPLTCPVSYGSWRRPSTRPKDSKGTAMPKEEWGVKRLCPTTGKRFYDLNKDPIVSPYTGEVVELDLTKGRMIASDAADRSNPANAVSDEDDIVLDDDDVDVDLDDELLDDDDDDNVSLDDIADMSADDDES